MTTPNTRSKMKKRIEMFVFDGEKNKIMFVYLKMIGRKNNLFIFYWKKKDEYILYIKTIDF